MTWLRRRLDRLEVRRAPGPLAVLALKMNGETRVIAMEHAPDAPSRCRPGTAGRASRTGSLTPKRRVPL